MRFRSVRSVISFLAARSIFAACCLISWLAYAQAPSFVTFESLQVRPLAMSADGTRLFATNTPDNRLEIFNLNADGMSLAASVRVGMEPVAVAVRNNNEVWVVNHLSDSVSIVDVSGELPFVKKTLLVGDEPRDIVFSANDRAFITTARRGQHRTHPSLNFVPGAGDPKFDVEGTPRADVWVFDAANLGTGLGGTPLKIVELFGDTPRGLGVSPDGKTVYAAIHFSGNQTASVSEGTVCPHGRAPCNIKGQSVPNDIVGPKTNAAGERAPLTGTIVKYDQASAKFVDAEGEDWSDVIKYSLPDRDVFAIDSESLNETAAFPHVGTILFNVVTNPVSGAVYVSNIESNNFEQFEGPGLFGGSTVQGHIAEARITVIKNGSVAPRHLNKHIDYAVTPAPPGVKQHSLSQPMDMVVSDNGEWLAVAAFGSNKVGVFNTEELENDSFNPTQISDNYISVSGGGPSGLALDELKNRLYVLTRYNNSVAVIDLESQQEIASVAMLNPEPTRVVEGRPFLYDATLTSSNGEASCGGCHIGGDLDNLAWNLGNPDDEVTKNPLRVLLDDANGFLGVITGLFVKNLNGTGETQDFHPMKGPMATQTLRGMQNHGHMHWRADRATGFFGDEVNREQPFDEELSFKNFIVAFEGLLGRESLLSEADMQKFTDFTLEMVLPPNPIRAIDNSLSRAEARGREFFMGCDGPGLIICNREGRPVFGDHLSDGIPLTGLGIDTGFTCEACHKLDLENGFFGTDGRMAFDVLNQTMKIAHIRNVYTKIGKFGNPTAEKFNSGDNANKGEQVRGFGVFHDGGLDTVERFMNAEVFNSNFFGFVGFNRGAPQRRDIQSFMFAFDSDLPPVVGQQISLTGAGNSVVHDRIDTLIERAEADFTSKLLGGQVKECDLVVSGVVDNQTRGWLYDANLNVFKSDVANQAVLSDSQLRTLASTKGATLTFTCVPFGSGTRVALDRDLDGVFDGDSI